ncbi:MAG: hypothetical protein KC613_13655 [Myxococcales bacterium]|nr:hypothetical protein [Myxococcales bacterium]MCB9525920.1 hypothetical protein [Myxococcales bacterium]
MSHDPHDPPKGGAAPDEPLDEALPDDEELGDDELGEPITATLEKLQAIHPVSADFDGRLERRIERIQVTADLGRMWWEVPGAAVKELLRGLFTPSTRPARRRPPPPKPTQANPGDDDG